MRYVMLDRSHKGITKIALLALILFAASPGQVFAAAESCNPDLDFTILNEAPFFAGDPMRVSANLGARDIQGGNYLDIPAFGFGTDCNTGEDFHSCSETDAQVEFLGNFSTDCTQPDGSPAQLFVPQGIVPIRVLGSSIRTAANTQCNVQFDMAVLETAPGTNRITQAMGWPVVNEAAATCDNGLTSAASSTISYDVQSCGIEVIKEVWDPLTETWVDANTDPTAPMLGPDDKAAYRLKVKNTSSVDFIGDLHVVDTTLGVDALVTPDFDDNGDMIIGGGDGSVFDISEACADLLESGEGIFTNTASVEGTCRGPDHSLGAVTALASDIAKVDCRKEDPQERSILLQKHTNGVDADAPTGPYIPVGDAVNWTYYIYNTGVEGIQLDSLTDDKVPALGLDDCDKTFIAEGEFATCSASGVATEGQYANVATVNGTSDYTNSPVSDSDPSHYFGMVASIDLVKTPDPMIYGSVGQEITYTFQVTNTSNVVLTNVNVTDPLPGLSAISCPATELAANGGTMDCTATYNITQADMDAKVVNNTATARGTAPNGTEVSDQDTATISTEPIYSLALVKTAAPLTYSAEGQVITYAYQLSNDGNQTLYPPYSVADDKSTDENCPDQPAMMLPGESILCTATYTIGAGDLPDSATSVTNVAQGKAYDAETGGNEVLSNTDDETVYYIGISVRKEILDGESWVDANTADAAPVKHYPAGALYRVVVANIGVVDLTNVVITDVEIGLIDFAVNGGSLAAGQEVTVTEAEAPVLNQEAVCDASGEYMNTVNASGTATTSGLPVNDSDVAWLACVGTPDIVVKKYISIDNGETWEDDTAGPVEFPSGALYRITVENTGQTDLVDVQVTDSLIAEPNPPGYYEVGALAAGQMVTISEGEWSELRMTEVCGSSGRFQNVASVIGTSAEYDEDTTDTDDAFLDCIGPPMISILKEVSLDDGANWHDADDPPYPTAVVDATPDTALYRITVGNIGTVPLFNVLVNDDQLGIVNHPVGSLNPGETAVIDSGVIAGLTVENVCSSSGEKTNTANAVGTSAAGETDQASDSATVDCIGKPEIRILKEVSADGVTWYDDEVTALAPSDAFYRITVSNIGNVALNNVTVTDATLGINENLATLAIGETVVLTHDGSGDVLVEDLLVNNLCVEPGSIPNLAVADGKSAESTETVRATDDALFICATPVDICEEYGRPSVLKMMYNGTYSANHHQGVAGVIVPDTHPDPGNTALDLPGVATIELYDKNELEDTVVKAIGEPFNILGSWTPAGKIPPNITIKIYDGEALRQTITFHGSCSAPLLVGDKFGGATIIGYTP